MALIFRNIGLAIYEQTEWDKMTIAEQNQARADYNLFVAPDGIRQALDTDAYTLTDMGNAELFLAISGCRVHYDDAKKSGYVYGLDPRNGCIDWVPDSKDVRLMGELDKVAHTLSDMLKALDERRATADTSAKIKAVRKTLTSRLTSFAGPQAKRIADRIHTQTTDPKIIMDDPNMTGHLINLPNGTLDLWTGQIRPASPDDYISQGMPTEYHAGARTDDVDAWWNSICATPEIMRQLQQVLGMALDAGTRTKKMPILYGSTTNNGKTTTAEIPMDTIGRTQAGGYGQTIGAGAFDVGTRTGGRCTPELATCVGARLVVMSEPDENQRVDWSYVKEITGGGSIHVNPKNKDAYDYPAIFTLMLDTNYLVKVGDPTLFRRGTIQVVPFFQEFSKERGNLDETLRERMRTKENREAILAAIVAGCRDYHNNGKRFVEPPEAREILDRYQTNNDRIGEFLEQYYTKVEGRKAATTYISCMDVYRKYLEFLDKNGYKNPENSASFKQKLASRARVEIRDNCQKLIGYVEKNVTASTIHNQEPLEWFFRYYMVEDPTGSINFADLAPEYARAVEVMNIRPLDEKRIFVALAEAGYDVSIVGGVRTLTGWRMLSKSEIRERDDKATQALKDAHRDTIQAAIDGLDNLQLQIALRMIWDAGETNDNVRDILDLIANGPKDGRLPF